jgi:hypothetical protein
MVTYVFIRFTLAIILPHPSLLKQFQQVSLFYYHTCIQPTLTIFTLLHPLTGTYPSTRPVLSSYPSFFNVCVDCSRGFCHSISQCIYCILYINQINLLYDLLFIIAPLPYYSTNFSAFSYAIFIHRCNVFWYYSLSFSFPHLPQSPQTDALLQICSLFSLSSVCRPSHTHTHTPTHTHEEKHVTFVLLSLVYFT